MDINTDAISTVPILGIRIEIEKYTKEKAMLM